MYDKDIKLIAMDMDGTLLNSAQVISEGNMRALQAARDHGIHLAICSGRLPGDIAIFAQQSGLSDCAVLSLNGSYCTRDLMDGCFADHTFADETLQRIVDIAVGERIPFGCFAQNTLVLFKGSFGRQDDFWGKQSEHPHSPRFLYEAEGLAAVRDGGVNKVMVFFADEAQMQRVHAQLAQVEGLDITTSWPLNFELMPAGVNKGRAVAEMAAFYGLDASQVMTLGDYDNDETMIAYAGCGVAMGNATPCIRNAARYVTKTNDEDGVAYAIYRHALKQDI